MTDDATLLAQVRRMWEVGDPPPVHLAERVLFALELEDLDTEFELLRLTERADALAGTRGQRSTSNATHITFSGTDLTVMLAVGSPSDDTRRIDGWIAPGASVRVVAHTVGGEQETTADASGRFVLEGVPTGMLRLVLHPTDAERTPFITPTVEV